MKYFPSNARKRVFAGLAMTAAAALALTACGGGSGSGGSGTPAASGSGGGGGGGKVAITLITKDANNPYWVAMQQGAKAAAEAQGAKLTIGFGAKDGDEAGQVSAIEDSIARADKGILISPNGPGVSDAITKAKDAGISVIALDTLPTPANVVDATIATDNFKAGTLIGKWAAAQLAGKPAKIALLDLFNDKVVTVDTDRDQGFLTGMGIDVKDKGKNGDEDKSGKYTGGKGGDYTIACNEPTQGAADTGKTAMENCLSKTQDINVVYTINEPSATGAAEALSTAKVKNAIVVSVDGGCNPGITSVKSGVIGATAQQYPQKMAQLGVDAIIKMANGGAKPENSPGLEFQDAGVALVTDKPVQGLESIDSTKGAEVCWGKK
jgi:fructose transport system substrate-binding protein